MNKKIIAWIWLAAVSFGILSLASVVVNSGSGRGFFEGLALTLFVVSIALVIIAIACGIVFLSALAIERIQND